MMTAHGSQDSVDLIVQKKIPNHSGVEEMEEKWAGICREAGPPLFSAVISGLESLARKSREPTL